MNREKDDASEALANFENGNEKRNEPKKVRISGEIRGWLSVF